VKPTKPNCAHSWVGLFAVVLPALGVAACGGETTGAPTEPIKPARDTVGDSPPGQGSPGDEPGATPPWSPADPAPPSDPESPPPAPEPVTKDERTLLDARPYTLKVPSRYDKARATPFVVMLHGYSVTADAQEAYFKFTEVAEARTVLYAYADGTPNREARRFWNASDACCNFYSADVDDVKYIGAIVKDVSAKYNVDAARVYVVGHSNGGFMAHRLACDSASRFAAVVSLAGAQNSDPTRCNPSEPVSVLQIHGTNDTIIRYGGGSYAAAYPSAEQTVKTWADKNRCAGGFTDLGRRDLDRGLPGDESKIERAVGCPQGIDVELWTIQGGGHMPTLSATFSEDVFRFLLSHPKPKKP
jgi:polyhydroxybutyrate depolymerase